MSKKTIDLRYAKKSSEFISDLTEMKTTIKNKKDSDRVFSDLDENEISRNSSYALFPELQEEVKQKNQLTTARFRQALAERKVDNTAFQDKILATFMQSKAGIQFGLITAINDLLLTDKFELFKNNKTQKLTMEVENEHSVLLRFKGEWGDGYNSQPIVGVEFAISISPEMIEIRSCQLTQLADNEFADGVFNVLKQSEQNIFEKILSFVKQLFSHNHELRLEETTKEDEGLTTRLT
ncbi:MAG: hypothetical protein ACRC0M_07765 [Legionella sp.]